MYDLQNPIARYRSVVGCRRFCSVPGGGVCLNGGVCGGGVLPMVGGCKCAVGFTGDTCSQSKCDYCCIKAIGGSLFTELKNLT